MKAVKDRWDPLLVSWQRLHIGQKLPKAEFSVLLGKIWASLPGEVISNGFRKAGIYPFNDKVVPEETFDPDALQRWKDQLKVSNPPANPNENRIQAQLATLAPIEGNSTINQMTIYLIWYFLLLDNLIDICGPKNNMTNTASTSALSAVSVGAANEFAGKFLIVIFIS